MAHFRESQKFNQVWLWVVLLSLSGGVIAGIGYSLYQQLHLGYQLGLSDNLLILTSVLVLLLVAAVNWLILSGKLEVEINSKEIRYRFFPFVWNWKTINEKEIEKYEVKKYNPIMEYGGWGYRWKPRHGKALSVKGNEGLLLTLRNGKTLLLGTQKPDEANQAMKKLLNKAEYYG